jgi:hypothetical protein
MMAVVVVVQLHPLGYRWRQQRAHLPQRRANQTRPTACDARPLLGLRPSMWRRRNGSSSSGARSGVARRSSSGGAQLQPGAGGALQLPVKFNYRVIWIDLPVAGLDQAAWIVERGEGS